MYNNENKILSSIIIGFYLGALSLVSGQELSHIPMTMNIACAELDRKEVIEIFNEGMSGRLDLVKTEERNKLYVEVSNDRISSVEDLGLRNQLLYKENPE